MDSEPQTHCHDPREIVFVVNKRDTREIQSSIISPCTGVFQTWELLCFYRIFVHLLK